ncbi:flagellar basal body-associated FliL family protein [Sphingomonas sp. JC676]|nr:flagellar basal body-associated FliL family protein [Sphingomonas sp. JC676]
MSAEIVEEKVAAPAVAKPKSNKKLMVIGAATAAVLLLGGGGGTAFFLFSGSKAHAEGSDKDGKANLPPGAHGESGEREGNFVEVPTMVVNLRSPDGAMRFLKLHFLLVPGPNSDAAALKDKLPLILDSYQPFLRELRPEDLAGSAAVFRVKEEMLIRANNVAGAGSVSDILIEDLVQQ